MRCPRNGVNSKDVVDLRVVDTALRQLAGQPLVAVEVDLNLQWEPGLHAHVDETQFPVQEVVVQMQAFALGRLHVGLPSGEAQRERAARLEGREDAHQALRDALALGDLARRIFLAQLGAQVLERPPALARHGHRMRLDTFGVGQQERLDATAVDVVRLEQLRHRPARHDRQVATEQHAVEAGQHSVNAVLVLIDELLHGDLPPCTPTGRLLPAHHGHERGDLVAAAGRARSFKCPLRKPGKPETASGPIWRGLERLDLATVPSRRADSADP